MELTGTRRQRRELALRPKVYVTSPFKKGRAEVSERQLTMEQFVQLPPLLVLLAALMGLSWLKVLRLGAIVTKKSRLKMITALPACLPS